MTSRQSPLAIDGLTFRRMGHRLVDEIAAFLEAQSAGPVTRDERPDIVRQAIGAADPLPEQGADPEALLSETTRLLFDHSLVNGHPRFFGYVTASPAPMGMLGDFLAAAVNPNVGAWILSPAATEIEAQTVRWIAAFVGFPTDCGGLLVSGGNAANDVCLLAARAARAGYNVRERGVDTTRGRLRVYASTETHTWLQKATDLSGLGTDAIRWIPTDARQRMDVAALARTIDADAAAGDVPCMVVGTAGTVSTGAVDPLQDIAAICRARGVWFHVDGAYGGLAAGLADASADLRAMSLADSIAVDPHKWLYAPLEAGCALVRDAQALRAAFAYHPAYYHFGQEATNYVDYGPQNSRGFRALKVWLALKQVGAAGYRAMIAEDIALSRAMAAAVERHPDMELISQDLSITTFRYAPSNPGEDHRRQGREAAIEALNRALLDRLQRDGELFVSHAIVNGTFALRACIVNFHTTRADVEAVPEIVARAGRAIASETASTD